MAPQMTKLQASASASGYRTAQAEPQRKRRHCYLFSVAITGMEERRCARGMLDKKYASGWGRIVILRNPNSNHTDPCQNFAASTPTEVIICVKRRGSRTCMTDQKMLLLVQYPSWDGTVLIKRYIRCEKRKKAVQFSIKSCRHHTMTSGFGSKWTRTSKGICQVKGDNHLESDKNVKISKSATESGSREGGGGGTNHSCVGKGISYDIGEEDSKVQVIPGSLNALVPDQRGKKLLILDLNGLLVDICQRNRPGKKSDFRVSDRPAFKRPFCDDFLRFCFENFKIGIWSSRKSQYINKVVNIVMGDLRKEILFCWDQSKCTQTGYRALENVHKELLLKDMKKIWEKTEPGLPFEKGEYSPSNTLLIDDSPYKALLNPPHTAIFPVSYRFQDEDDNSLGPGGKLRCYLEGLAKADDVQKYVRDHPFGQPAISRGHTSWDFYNKILDMVRNKPENEVCS